MGLSPMSVADELGRLETSIGWGILRHLITVRVNALNNKLMSFNGAESNYEMNFIVAQIKAYKTLLSFPATYIDGAIAQQVIDNQSEEEEVPLDRIRI